MKTKNKEGDFNETKNNLIKVSNFITQPSYTVRYIYIYILIYIKRIQIMMKEKL